MPKQILGNCELRDVIGFSLCLAVFLGVMIFGCGAWIDKVSLAMVRAVKKSESSEAIQTGEQELEKGTAITAVKLNLIAILPP